MRMLLLGLIAGLIIGVGAVPAQAFWGQPPTRVKTDLFDRTMTTRLGTVKCVFPTGEGEPSYCRWLDASYIGTP